MATPIPGVEIAVGIDPPSEEKIIAIENVCSGAAAVQNMLLAAHDLGLGAMWRTGTAASDPTVKAFLGFSPEQKLIAFVYVGDGPVTTSGYAQADDQGRLGLHQGSGETEHHGRNGQRFSQAQITLE